MTCPKCGGRCEDIAHFSGRVDDEEYGMCLVSQGICQTCRFEVDNITWLDETGEVQDRMWMTGHETPKDVPKTAWNILEKTRDLI